MSTGSIEFRRLGSGDIDDILALLNATWPVLYGATGSPVFSRDYLAWLYAGPASEQHHLLGAVRDGELVGFKAYLHRQLAHGQHSLDGYIATHLAIDPGLQLGERMVLAAELGKLHPLEEGFEGPGGSQDRAVLAFFEQGKNLIRNVEKLHDSAGIHTTHLEFQQAIVMPSREPVQNIAGLSVRECTAQDVDDALGLLDEVARDGLTLRSGREQFWHHLSAAPRGRAWLAEQEGRPCGLLACYLLETTKNDRIASTMVIETLACPQASAIKPLLAEASAWAKTCGARGLVLENTTFLPEDDCREAGILPTPRHMVLAFRSRSEPVNFDRFICDIK